MTNFPRQALVTGASSGIGAAFGRRLAKEGYALILVARRQDRLQALAGELGGAEVMVADLTEDGDLRQVEERISTATNLELLVNNAGFGTNGRFFETPLESQDQMHRLHVMATLRLTHRALPGMVSRGKGAVINVSSVAGFLNSSGNVSYCATKAWMNSFTEGLDLELKGVRSPVRVQALCPGFTYSEFHDVMPMDRGRVPARLWMRAEAVVEASLRGLSRDELFVVPGIYKLLLQVERRIPRWLVKRLTARYERR